VGLPSVSEPQTAKLRQKELGRSRKAWVAGLIDTSTGKGKWKQMGFRLHFLGKLGGGGAG